VPVAVTAAALTEDPHPVLRALREEAPVAWADELGGWLVLTRELCLRVVRDAATFTVDDPRFSTARVVGPSMLSLDGPEHDRHRAPFARRFRLDAVREQLGPVVDAETHRLVDAVAAAGEMDLRRALAGPLAAAVMRVALGLRGEVADVLRWYEAIVAAVDADAPGREVEPAGAAAFAELAGAIGPDLGAAGELTRAQTVSNAAVLLFGGIETTEGMIANAVWHLLSDPPALATVRADPALLLGVVEESLRLEPAAARVDRYATADVELGGARIARGDLVMASISAANRDPAAFPDPDRFDPSRPDARRHLTFAAGPHVCLGMHLARLEAHTALAVLLERLPGLRLDPDRPAAPRGLVFRKPPALWVRWDA
jgi:cytochrome P450